MAKTIRNLAAAPRALQFTPEGSKGVEFLEFTEAGTKGASFQVDDATWKALQSSKLIKAMLEGPDFQVV